MLKIKQFLLMWTSLIGQEDRYCQGADRPARGEGKVRDVVWTVVLKRQQS